MFSKAPSASSLAITMAATFSLALATPITLAGKGNGKGKPGDGGGEDPPPPPPVPAPVEYTVSWFPGTFGATQIYDVNAAGIAVGRYHDEAGERHAFWTQGDGTLRHLADTWTLPAGFEGWRLGRGESAINDANQVAGIMVNEQTLEYWLYLAQLGDPSSLEPLGAVSSNASWLDLNDHGDVAVGYGGPYLYVRSTNRVYSLWDEARGPELITGLNNQLQLSVMSWADYDTNGNGFDGCARWTFDPVSEVLTQEVISSAVVVRNEAISLAYGIDHTGRVLGAYEEEAPHRKRRTSSAKAGYVEPGTTAWTSLDSELPTGSSHGRESWIRFEACALKANDSGLVLGGYGVHAATSEALWIRDTEGGLHALDDLVVGTAGDVEAFRAGTNFQKVQLSQAASGVYGFISGYDYAGGGAFILTPQLVEAP